MNEILDVPQIKNLYFAGFARPKDIEEIVVHGTGGGTSVASLLKWMIGGERAERYKKGIGLFHYAIDRTGDIYRIINDEYWVYHSGSGNHDQKTIGIELVNPSADNKMTYTEHQYIDLVDLCKYLVNKWPKIKAIVSHNYNQTTYSQLPKNCPGAFEWDKFSELLEAAGVKNKQSGEVISIG